MTDLVIDWIGGNCPVQSEGTVRGIPYYFRSRHENWTFSLGSDPITWEIEALDFHVSGLYKKGEPEQAGYMPEDEAREIIKLCAELYINTVGKE